jgi:putative transposase
VHSADLQERAALPLALEGAAEEFPRLEHLWVDQGYTGKAWIEEQLGWSVEVVKHPPKARGEWQPRGDVDDLSKACIWSGFGFQLNRRDFAAHYPGAG